MGHEVFYCSGCQTQIRSGDFEKGKAYKLLGLEAICSPCAPEALKTLPPDKLQALQKAMGAPPASHSKSGTGRLPLASTAKSGTGRVPLATPTPKSGTRRIPLAAPSSTRKIAIVVDEDRDVRSVVLFAVAMAVAILVVLFAMSGSRSTDPAPVRTIRRIP